MQRLSWLLLALVACGDNIVPKVEETPDAPSTPPDGPDIDAAACADEGSTRCDGDDVVTCTGGVEVRDTCALGCNSVAVPARCATPVPSNLPDDTCLTAGATDLAVAAGATLAIDTSTGCDVLHAQGAGLPMICIKKFANVTIADTATVTSTGPNALSIVATTAMTIDGIVDASSTAAAPGPAGTTPGGAGDQPTQISAGGGGAGYLTAGGKGAVSSQITGGQGGAAGAAFGNGQLIPARGGAAGGAGGPQPQRTAVGGFGGGAIQLASCGTLSLGATAVIDAGGGGGAGGNGSLQATLDPGGGGGGGSGGAIWLEAPTVTIAGGVFANGGGGGSGGAHGSNNTPGVDGNPGQDGPRSATPANGGPGVIVGTVVTGGGGKGGALGAQPTNGGTPTATIVESSGGGGGAAGRIRINVRTGTTATLTGSTISPAPTAGTMASN